MRFNFKNKNIIIILLLLLVFASVFCYSMLINDVEGNTNMNQNKSWDLDIEQTQKFDIEGTIGDRWTIEVEQDSEADFDWENNMFLKYKGESNDIFQKAEAGNISLNLPSTKFACLSLVILFAVSLILSLSGSCCLPSFVSIFIVIPAFLIIFSNTSSLLTIRIPNIAVVLPTT